MLVHSVRRGQGVPSVASRGAYDPDKRFYQIKKISPEQIQAAQAQQQRQRVKFVDKFYKKWIINRSGKKEKVEKEKRDDMDKKVWKGRRRGQKEERGVAKKEDGKDMYQWHERYKEEWRDRNADVLGPILSVEVIDKCAELHQLDPYFWNPVRLANKFKTKVEWMRGHLFEAKLVAERNKRLGDEEIDDRWIKNIRKGWMDDFGFVDYSNQFEGGLMHKGGQGLEGSGIPEFRTIRKNHNPWYYISPGINSAALARYLRRRETRKFQEGSKIPQQELGPPQEFPEILGPGQTQRKGPWKKVKYVFHETRTRDHYSLYDRPVIVRDENNCYRLPNWEERRKIFNASHHQKKPIPRQFIMPDMTQKDRVATVDTPPFDFDLYFVDHTLTGTKENYVSNEDMPNLVKEIGEVRYDLGLSRKVEAATVEQESVM